MRKYNIKQEDKQFWTDLIKNIIALPKSCGHEEVAKLMTRSPLKGIGVVSKSSILKAYREFEEDLNLTSKEKSMFYKRVRMKSVRTISGVTPVTVLTKPFPCPGDCIFCPNDGAMPKSYLSKEPGAQRAGKNLFDPYLQTHNRLCAYKNIGHPTSKVELIILGGSWNYYPSNYQKWFIKRCFEAMNNFNPEESERIEPKKSPVEDNVSWNDFEDVQKQNETAECRCVGLVVETRPDLLNKEEVIKIRKLGGTKVQIGVQSLNNKILQMNNRRHTIKETKKAFKVLRLAGFKIHAHWMPNLYGSNPEKDFKDFQKLFSDRHYKPDELKFYPTTLVQNTKLMELYKNKEWAPYSDEVLFDLAEKCFLNTPSYCRITRVIRDISAEDIIAGTKKSNLRQLLNQKFDKQDEKPVEIRYREIRNKKVDTTNLSLKITKYITSVSEEYFLEYITPDDHIAGFLRLSLPNKNILDELKSSAVIREVHIYGQSLSIGFKQADKAQHMGLGKNLIQKAIRITKDNKYKDLAVISSVGTRQYYRSNGFTDGRLYQHYSLN